MRSFLVSELEVFVTGEAGLIAAAVSFACFVLSGKVINVGMVARIPKTKSRICARDGGGRTAEVTLALGETAWVPKRQTTRIFLSDMVENEGSFYFFRLVFVRGCFFPDFDTHWKHTLK